MPRRQVLTKRQRARLLDLATDPEDLIRHYTLGDEDLENIGARRRDRNRLGFALQLCTLRFPGRALAPGELIPTAVLEYIGAQLGMSADILADYAVRRQTRQEHMEALKQLYGYKSFEGQGAQDIGNWVDSQAESASTSEALVRSFIERCRHTRTILPAVSTIERMCADALVAADVRVDDRIASRISTELANKLDALINEPLGERLTRFTWLRQKEVGRNSSDASCLLDRLEFLQDIGASNSLLDGVHTHRIVRLKRQGERYFADGLRDLSRNRRLAVLAVCAVEWRADIADALIETHERIVGKAWRAAQKLGAVHIEETRSTTEDTLSAFAKLGEIMLSAHADGASVEEAIETAVGWSKLASLVGVATLITDPLAADPLSFAARGVHRFRRYAPRMVRSLNLQGASTAKELLSAISAIGKGQFEPEQHHFLPSRSKWHRVVKADPNNRKAILEVAAWFGLRDGLRSGDIWLPQSRRYADIKDVLVPVREISRVTGLKIPLAADDWLSERRSKLKSAFSRLSDALRTGDIPSTIIRDGGLHVKRLKAIQPRGIDSTISQLAKRMPEVRVTDLLQDVDDNIGFTDAFTHLRTGAPCKDKLGLLNVLLAEGLNLGLSKLGGATDTHDYWELMRLSRWHVEREGLERSLAVVIEAQRKLPLAKHWGQGLTASADGQFFTSSRHGEAGSLVNAKYGRRPGVKAYTHVSDQYGPFAVQTIPATVNEAPYILDGLLMNEAGTRIREQYADTGGFTDHVFGTTSLLGYRFVPRIRDLPTKRVYLFADMPVPGRLSGLVGGRIREDLILSNWPDLLRMAATMSNGSVRPSEILRKLASYPRQNDLAAALREVGRIERTLFMIEWVLDEGLQRRTQAGLNKGESHHALKNALRIGRQGEVRDRTAEGRHFRMAGLNLLAAIVIYWNTARMGEAVEKCRAEGIDLPDEHLAHLSPLGWAHIQLTGEYRWKERRLRDP